MIGRRIPNPAPRRGYGDPYEFVGHSLMSRGDIVTPRTISAGMGGLPGMVAMLNCHPGQLVLKQVGHQLSRRTHGPHARRPLIAGCAPCRISPCWWSETITPKPTCNVGAMSHYHRLWVSLMLGLRSTSSWMTYLLTSYGGGRLRHSIAIRIQQGKIFSRPVHLARA